MSLLLVTRQENRENIKKLLTSTQKEVPHDLKAQYLLQGKIPVVL